MTYTAAACFDASLVDDRHAPSAAAGRALRVLLSSAVLGAGAVAFVGVTAVAVTLAAGWMTGGVMQPQARLPGGPGSLALVPYDSTQVAVARASSSSPWADAFIDRSRPIIASADRAHPAVAEPKAAPARQVARARAIPLPRPLPASLTQARVEPEPAPVRASSQILAKVELPHVRPEIKPEAKPETASRGDTRIEIRPEPKAVAAPKPAAPTSVPAALPDSVSRTAVYDITGSTVHMPDGSKLEAHSGLGEKMDDPRYIKTRMRGPTPPNVYVLTEREKLFHGVRAIRLNPVHEDRMFGRDGMLAHTYMLGPNGQSNGCVSFRDYRKFLDAFLDGKVDKLVVVGDLGGASWRTAALQAEGVEAPPRRYAGGTSRPRAASRDEDEEPSYTSALGFMPDRAAGTW